MLNQHERTSTVRTRSYVSVTFGFIILGNQNSSVAAAYVAAAATTATIAAAAAAVGHTRPGPALLYAQLVDLTLEPFVYVLDFVVSYLLPNSKFGIIWKRKSSQPDTSNRASRSRCHH